MNEKEINNIKMKAWGDIDRAIKLSYLEAQKEDEKYQKELSQEIEYLENMIKDERRKCNKEFLDKLEEAIDNDNELKFVHEEHSRLKKSLSEDK